MEFDKYPHFRIDRKDFLRGGNAFDNYPNGGIKRSFYGYNAFSKPGALSVIPDPGSSSVTGSLQIGVGISWGRGKGTITQEQICIGNNSSQDGYFYTIDEDTGGLTLVGSADTTQDYAVGFTDTIFYNSRFYTTSKTDITENVFDLTAGSRDVSWWVATKGQSSLNSFSPHPMVIYGDIMYIADGQYLHQNDNGTVTANVLDLGTDWVITALVKYNNLIYIAAEPYFNLSGTQHGNAKIFTWDGYSPSFIDEYEVDYRINAMYVFKNVLYVWTNTYMGYFTGGVVKNFYPLTGGLQVTWSKITATDDSLWFPDGAIIVRFGSPVAGVPPAFHRYFPVNSNPNGIVALKSNALLFGLTGASAGSNIYVANVNGTPSGQYAYQFNKRFFTKPVKVRGYILDTLGVSSGTSIRMQYIDDTGTARGDKTFTGSDSSMLGKQKWRFEVFSDPATRFIDPQITIAGNVYLLGVDIFYEPVEENMNM